MIPNLSDIKFDGITLAEKKNFPQFSVIYGAGGIGKTYLAAHTENPVIVPIGRETGHEAYIHRGVPCFQPPEGMEPLDFVFGSMAKLLKTDHNRKTAIFDNLGSYREIIDEVVEKNAGKDEKLDAYGRRQALSFPFYSRLLAGFNALMVKKNMNIILICHSIQVNINKEDGSYYSRIGIHAPRGENTNVAALLEARAHNIFFLRGESTTRKIKGALGVDRIIPVGGLKRTLHTKESSGFFAKSRCEIPEFFEINDDQSILEFWEEVYK